MEPILKRGDTGDAVSQLQAKLVELGFLDATPTGTFAEKTEAALKRFQKKYRLQVTGWADAATLRALGFQFRIIEIDDRPKRGNNDGPPIALGFNILYQLFPDADRDNINRYAPPVFEQLQAFGLNDLTMTCMALATIRAETAGFVPISEYQSKYNTDPGGPPFAKYDYRQDIGNNAPGDGAKYKGRGFVQLTGKDNYRRYSQKLGLGSRLLDNPELANDPVIAAKLLAAFLKDKESEIRSALAANNLEKARRLVNGGTHGLDAFSKTYRLAQEKIT